MYSGIAIVLADIEIPIPKDIFGTPFISVPHNMVPITVIVAIK